jgi:hypothetical protein
MNNNTPSSPDRQAERSVDHLINVALDTRMEGES